MVSNEEPSGFRQPRIIWFCDLEALQEDLAILRVLRDEIGLTTIAPESHICHTSGFSPSPEVVDASPLEGWRTSPTLRLHRERFHVAEPAFAVLPGVVSGFDDAPLLRVVEECRRLGIEVWGHAGLWCYGGEVFPELAVRDLFGRPLPETSLEWGTCFCPSKPSLHEWIKLSLVDVARRYDLDGMFLDHARYTSPGDGPSLLVCGCEDCEAQATARGYRFDDFRQSFRAFRETLGELAPNTIATLTAGGPVELFGRWADHRGVLDWFIFRARLLADQFHDLARAIRDAVDRPFPIGTDVFPPSVAPLGGHLYREWARSVSYFTGGFGGKIGWSTVGTVTIDGLSTWLRSWAPRLDGEQAARAVAALIGYDDANLGLRFDRNGRVDVPDLPIDIAAAEARKMAAVREGLPVYPPLSGGMSPAALRRLCSAIVEAGLSGAMFSGLDRLAPEERTIVSNELSAQIF